MNEAVPPTLSQPASEVRLVDVNISLDQAESIDILLLQWHTPSPVDANGVWRGADPDEVSAKGTILQALGDTIAAARVRAMFVVIPELSLPLGLVPHVDAIAAAAARPVIIVAGLEHMTVEQYSGLRKLFDVAVDPVDRQSRRRVNAAGIWIATGDHTHRYLQLKRGLSDAEHNDFTYGVESFLFRSPDQRDGRRLNFAVGICADFTNRDRVLHWRRQAGVHENVTALDLMLLLQMNANQEAVQFRTAVSAYFEPPVPLVAPEATLIATDKSALIFVNQAATDATGTTFGRSSVHFHFDGVVLKRSDGAPTFFLEDQSGYLHHSAIFREDRSSAYLLEYVPLHRRNVGVAGSNDPPVFRSARYCDLRNASPTLVFTEISPVIHWLLRAMEAAEADIAAEAIANFRMPSPEARAAAIASWRELWNSAVAWWRSHLNSDETSARQQLAVLGRDAIGREPRRWHLEESVRLLVRAFVLLCVGKERTLELCGTPCSNMKIDQRLVAFVSGRRRWTWKTTVDQFYDAHRTRLDALGMAPLLVIQEATGDIPWNSTYALPHDITADASLDADDITARPRTKSLRCTGTATLYDQLCESASFDDACVAVATRVDEVLL